MNDDTDSAARVLLGLISIAIWLVKAYIVLHFVIKYW